MTYSYKPRAVVFQNLVILLFVYAGILLSQASAQKAYKPFPNGPTSITSKQRVQILVDRDIVDSKSYIVVKIVVPNDSAIDAFLLPSPPRMVIDFVGTKISKNEAFKAPPNDVIEQIRLGAHAKKTRVVIDLLTKEAPQYEWKAGKRQAIIRFLEGSVQVSAPPTVVPTAAPIIQPTKAPEPVKETVATLPKATLTKPKGGAVVKSDHVATLGDLEPKKKPFSPPTAIPTSFHIKQFAFERIEDKSQQLRFSIDKPGAKAQISKVDEETYKVEIPDCGITNSELAYPQFPPHYFTGFVLTMAETVDNKVEITIAIEEGTKLVTAIQGTEIIIKKD